MPAQKNLCALIPIELHQRVSEEKDRLEQTTSQYITNLITEYFALKDKGGDRAMPNTRTLAFQIPEELFQRIKLHLERESGRLGRKVTQREFILGLIESALEEEEARVGPVPPEPLDTAPDTPSEEPPRVEACMAPQEEN